MASEFDDLLGDGEFAQAPAVVAPLVNPTNAALDVLTDPEQLLVFLEATKLAPYKAIDALAVSQGYAAAVFMYRKAALAGDYKTAKALQLWIEWANAVQSRPPEEVEEKIVNPNVQNFLPRNS